MWSCESVVSLWRFRPGVNLLVVLESGTAFVIMNKAKGWWVVQKDTTGTGNVPTENAQSGWIPAGKPLPLSPNM